MTQKATMSGGKPTLTQFLIRYLCYCEALLPVGIGIIWVGIDKRKQGWHDKIAGTMVIRTPQRKEAVKFGEQA